MARSFSAKPGALPGPLLMNFDFSSLKGARLSYEQFSQFLQNIKELNAGRQSREDTLGKAKNIFGSDNNDLYVWVEFRTMRARNAMGMAVGSQHRDSKTQSLLVHRLPNSSPGAVESHCSLLRHTPHGYLAPHYDLATYHVRQISVAIAKGGRAAGRLNVQAVMWLFRVAWECCNLTGGQHPTSLTFD
eukprot:scaffold182571_cov37-Prasinocladus_malaysianus.AAC.1